ncbi:hypothetical protein EDD21DRAFT_8616 [Dissophora ornata]|nr:hypothetical protein EDD21DRAFT_8616 [Dissophora ornata]
MREKRAISSTAYSTMGKAVVVYFFYFPRLRLHCVSCSLRASNDPGKRPQGSTVTHSCVLILKKNCPRTNLRLLSPTAMTTHPLPFSLFVLPPISLFVLLSFSLPPCFPSTFFSSSPVVPLVLPGSATSCSFLLIAH